VSIRPHQHESFSFPVDSPQAQPEVSPRRFTMPHPVSAMSRHMGRGWQSLRESGLVVVAILVYFLVRGLMSTSVDRAHDHALELLRFERWLGIAWEAEMQGWAANHGWLADLMNSIYIYGHWPVISLTLVWLLWKHGDEFRVVRTAMVLSGLIGFFFFALYPMAPPRFLTELGFVDTVMRDTSSYRVLQPPAFTNQYAAMPSLHVGWNLLMGIAIFRTTRYTFWRGFAVLMPLAMYISTILTANHFVLDGIVGSIVALIGLTLARYLYGRKGKRVHDIPHPRPAGRGRPLDLATAGAGADASGHAG
jgi:hypothetical protein